MAKKLPFMTLFTGDWTRDTRVLSMEARALWIDLLCLMWEGDRRGYLSRGGQPFLSEDVARHCGCPVEVVDRGFAELLRLGVASKDEEGVIFSRRIVRDDRRRRTNALNGRRGGNPSLKGSDNRSVNPSDKDADKAPMEYGIGNGIGVSSSAAGGGGVGAGGRRRFVPPTVAEVADYCRERGNSVDAETFVNHYISNGWKVGRNAMRSWKAAVCTWEKNDFTREKPAAAGRSAAVGEAWAAVRKVVSRWGDRLWKAPKNDGWKSERMQAMESQQADGLRADLDALPAAARQAAECYGWRAILETDAGVAFAQFSKIFDGIARTQ